MSVGTDHQVPLDLPGFNPPPIPRWLAPLAAAVARARMERDQLSIGHAVELVAEDAARNPMANSSLERFRGVWQKFVRFALAYNVVFLGQVDSQLVRSFVSARTRTGRAPSTSTQHLRRAALRNLFGALRRFGLYDADPTRDLVLPKRSYMAHRPLTDREIEACRAASLGTVWVTRWPSIWALAEAGATTTEIGRITIADLDLNTGRVWIAGGPKTDARWGVLTEWGCLQLARRLRSIGPEATSLIYNDDSSEHSRRTGTVEVLRRVLREAGLLPSKGYRPGSIRGWLGAAILDETDRIEEVAFRLGLRSLDQAAALIGHSWLEHGP